MAKWDKLCRAKRHTNVGAVEPRAVLNLQRSGMKHCARSDRAYIAVALRASGSWAQIANAFRFVGVSPGRGCCREAAGEGSTLNCFVSKKLNVWVVIFLD
jgi:hypothetical protein